MHSAVQALGRRFIAQEAVPGAVAFAIAEFFYKFHSFALECLAFLATWYILSFLWSKARGAAS
ncbi:MAG: hypothetical protein HC855_12305 [Rhizobiales bacterium]|nr:hypothetical protein [Hyphomicrobiales bacterium]